MNIGVKNYEISDEIIKSKTNEFNILLHFLNTFSIVFKIDISDIFLNFRKIEKIQFYILFHFSHIFKGRSWADHGAIKNPLTKHARFQKSWPLRGSRKYQNFSFFTNEQHVFQSIELFVQYFVKKGVFWTSSCLTLNLTISCVRRIVS